MCKIHMQYWLNVQTHFLTQVDVNVNPKILTGTVYDCCFRIKFKNDS